MYETATNVNGLTTPTDAQEAAGGVFAGPGVEGPNGKHTVPSLERDSSSQPLEGE